jgi:hypothetical protein
MILNIGAEILTYKLTIRRRSVQGFIIEWYDGVTPMASLDGQQIKVVIGSRDNPTKEYSAFCEGHISTFPIDEIQSDLPFNLYDGMIIRISPSGETALVNLRIEVGPS